MYTASTIVLWLLNLSLDTAGQVAFKKAAMRPGRPGLDAWLALLRDGWLAFGIACYCAEFLAWLAFLTLVPLSVAVLLAAANIVTVAVAGRVMFGESPGALRTTGMLLIAAGVAIVGVGGQ